MGVYIYGFHIHFYTYLVFLFKNNNLGQKIAVLIDVISVIVKIPCIYIIIIYKLKQIFTIKEKSMFNNKEKDIILKALEVVIGKINTQAHVATKNNDCHKDKILNLIRKHDDGVSLSKIVRTTRTLSRKQRFDILSELEETKLVSKFSHKGKTKPFTMYRSNDRHPRPQC